MAQMWFSQLSLGEVTRIAANQYMSTVDVCEEIAKVPPADDGLPRSCPVAAGRRLPFQTQIGKALWEGVEEYRSTVVGASGELELRLFSGAPCDGWFDTDCEEPETLLGLTLPFQIVDGEGNREGHGEGNDDGEDQQEAEKQQAPGKSIVENGPAPPSTAKAVVCEDSQPDCVGWARAGECDANPQFMREACQKSCRICGGATEECVDDNTADCPGWANDGQCETNPEYMLYSCKKSCRVCAERRDEL